MLFLFFISLLKFLINTIFSMYRNKNPNEKIKNILDILLEYLEQFYEAIVPGMYSYCH